MKWVWEREGLMVYPWADKYGKEQTLMRQTCRAKKTTCRYDNMLSYFF